MKKALMMATVAAAAALAGADETDAAVEVETNAAVSVQAALVEKYGSAAIERFTCAEAANAVAEYAANPADGVLNADLGELKRAVLRSALGIVKRSLREHGRTFVIGPDGSNPVQEVLDALSAALNAPKMSGLSAWVAEWCPAGWTWIEPVWMTDGEIAAFEDALYFGDADFDRDAQTRLCATLGVEAYNAFVARYNGDATGDEVEGTGDEEEPEGSAMPPPAEPTPEESTPDPGEEVANEEN